MFQSIAHSWWLFALRGVAAIVFGMLTFVYPKDMIMVLIILFGAYALIDGVLAVNVSFQMQEDFDHWWVVLLEGLAGILVGVLVLINLTLSATALFLLVACWAVFTGLMEILAAILLSNEINQNWLMTLYGVLSVILGIILVDFPNIGTVGLIYVIGIYAIFDGLLMLYYAIKVHDLIHQLVA
ncbi:MAG TPA: DUF308 domain-containing protein [Anaerolineaceae bacterium]|nr:DUF308 domain-containing protein [Anaerolineaceae bacterium]